MRTRREPRALMLGFSDAFRLSQLASPDVADLAFGDRAVVVTVKYAKTDQKGVGREVAVPFVCCRLLYTASRLCRLPAKANHGLGVFFENALDYSV